VTMLDAAISASCNRVPVVDAHLVVVSVTLDAQPTHEQMIDAWDTWRAPELVRNLPTAPEHPTLYLRQQDRPQPRRDRAAGAGMTTTIGRLRPCSIFGYKFIALSHNTVRGAAGCAILNAELLTARGYFGDFQPARALQTV